jgi:hypothetical protein
MLDIRHKILLLLLSLTIIGEVLSVIIWANIPRQRYTLTASWEIAVLNAVVMITLNLLALFWIKKRSRLGPFFLIAISIGNRILSQLIFTGGMHLIFVTWTGLLVVFAYLEYRKLNIRESLILCGGIILALVASVLVFTFSDNSSFGVIVYALVLIYIISLIAIKKKAYFFSLK